MDQQKAKIKLYKKRDFGEVLGDTVDFIKSEFKPIAGAILKILLPIAALIAYFSTQVMDDTLSATMNPDQFPIDNPFAASFTSGNIIIALLGMASYLVLSLLIFQYFELYKNEDNVTFDMIWKGLFKRFLPLLGFFILAGLMMFLGFILLIIPGIYLIPVVSIATAIFIIERKGIGDSISRARRLLKGEWWMTFGLILVGGIVNAIISYAFAIPMAILTMAFVLKSGDVSALNGFSSSGLMIAYGICYFISLIGGYLSYMIPYTVTAFQYFSLVEKKESTSLLQEVDQFEEKGKQGNIEV